MPRATPPSPASRPCSNTGTSFTNSWDEDWDRRELAREDDMATTNRCRSWMRMVALPMLGLMAGLLAAATPATAQGGNDITFKQVAPDLHFLFDFAGSNVLVLTT